MRAILSKGIPIISGIILLAGCASKVTHISLADSFWQNPDHKIAIATVRPKQPGGTFYREGTQALLEVAVSSIGTIKFSRYLARLDHSWYHKMAEKFRAQLTTRKITATIYPSAITQKQLKKPHFIGLPEHTAVLLLELQALGAIRHYYSFFPTSAPKAYCVLQGKLIDSTNREVLWRHKATITEPVKGEWDQPPAYPNFTQSLESAIAGAQEEIIDSFFSGH